jgi:hypothetical protein
VFSVALNKGGILRNSSIKKATDHELQKYDNFTRYGQAGADGVLGLVGCGSGVL